MSNENMTWQEVCRELLRLDAEGVEEPWREFRIMRAIDGGWCAFTSLEQLFHTVKHGDRTLRLKPRAVRVTTRSGETLELPEPWWDVPEGEDYFSIMGWGEVSREFNHGAIEDENCINSGNAFRTKEDAQAWADAMPKIKGAK